MKNVHAPANFISDIFLVGAADMLKIARSLILMVLLTHGWGAERFGIWVQIKVTVAFLSPIVLLGMSDAWVRFLGGVRDVRVVRRGFSTGLAAVAAVGIVVASVLWVGAEPLSKTVFGCASMIYFARILALYLFCDSLDQLAMARFQSAREMMLRAKFLGAEVVGEVVWVAWVALQEGSLATVLAGLVAWKGTLLIVKLLRITSQTGLARPAWSVLNPYIAFGFPMVLANVFWVIVNLSDHYMINWLMGLREVGIYSVAYTIGSLVIVLFTPIDYVLYPTISELWNRGERDRADRYIQYAVKYLLLMGIPIVCMLGVLTRPLIRMCLPSEFLPVAPLIPLIAIAFLILSVGSTGQRVILMAKRSVLITKIYGALAVGNVFLNLMLIPRFGMVGAVYATLLTFSGFMASTWILASRYRKMSIDFLFLTKAVFSGLLSASLIGLLPKESLFHLLGAVCLGLIGYLAVLISLKSFSMDEWRSFQQAFSMLRRKTSNVRPAVKEIY